MCLPNSSLKPRHISNTPMMVDSRESHNSLDAPNLDILKTSLSMITLLFGDHGGISSWVGVTTVVIATIKCLCVWA
jgi:hypothetical protein